MTHTFEYDDETVGFSRATVGTNMEAYRLEQKLLGAYGHVQGNPAPDDVYANMREYAGAMARAKAVAPWYANSNMTDDQIKQAFELFLEQDELLWLYFRLAIQATAMPKKTPLATET